MKHTIAFHYVVRWSEEVEIDIPEGSTRAEIDALIDKAEADVAYDPPLDEVETERWEWVGPRPTPGHARWVDVPSVEIDGRVWSCDGWCAIRDDVPHPTERQETVAHVKPDQIAAFVRAAVINNTTDGVKAMKFHERYRALLDYADGRRRSGSALVLYRDGEPVAIVMPNLEGTLDAWGKP